MCHDGEVFGERARQVAMAATEGGDRGIGQRGYLRIIQSKDAGDDSTRARATMWHLFAGHEQLRDDATRVGAQSMDRAHR
jgi:hypothetical protein